jgi:hypothetical protein
MRVLATGEGRCEGGYAPARQHGAAQQAGGVQRGVREERPHAGVHRRQCSRVQLPTLTAVKQLRVRGKQRIGTLEVSGGR